MTSRFIAAWSGAVHVRILRRSWRASRASKSPAPDLQGSHDQVDRSGSLASRLVIEERARLESFVQALDRSINCENLLFDPRRVTLRLWPPSSQGF